MTQYDIDVYWMQQALIQAQNAADKNEVPVGAVLVHDNQCLAQSHNACIAQHDATAHAEVLALRQAGNATGNYRLVNSTLYVTIEPCMMCVGAITHARVKRLVYAAPEPKAGAVNSAITGLNHSALNHQIEVCSGILAQQSTTLLQTFFRAKR